MMLETSQQNFTTTYKGQRFMKEKLRKNLKAKGVHTTTRYNELFATYPITDKLKWTDQFTIDKTTENTIDKTLWILNHLPEDILKRVSDVSAPNYIAAKRRRPPILIGG